MHILMLVGKFPQLSETFIFRKAVALAKAGNIVTVAARDPGEWKYFQDQFPLPANLTVKILPPDNNWLTPRRITRAILGFATAFFKSPHQLLKIWSSSRQSHLRERVSILMRYAGFIGLRDIDLIHFEFLGLPAMYRFLPDLLGYYPYVVSCRGSDLNTFQQRDLSQQEQIRKSLLDAAAVHTVSDEMSNAVKRVSDRTAGVWINRPAVEVSLITQRPTPRSDEVPLILAVGRLVWIKGFDYLLAALAQLKADHIPFTAKILGGGDLYVELRFSIADLGLSDCVDLCGAVSPKQVLDDMQQASIFVLSSHEEGISNAVLEAMASGLPIVTTAAGGMAEAVRDGVDGFVVPVRDVDSIAERMKQLLLDPQLRMEMGSNARQRAEAEFSIQRQVKIFEAMYRSVLYPEGQYEAG